MQREAKTTPELFENPSGLFEKPSGLVKTISGLMEKTREGRRKEGTALSGGLPKAIAASDCEKQKKREEKWQKLCG